jgi:hypothetical protein
MKIPIFQQYILKRHREYMENKMQLTPTSLVTMADEESQVLKHSNQWVEMIDPSVLAMQAMVQMHHSGSADVFWTLAAHFSGMSAKQSKLTKDMTRNVNKDRTGTHIKPDWMYDKPQDLSQSRYFNGRHWYFCTKCGRNGRWVCTQSNDTHISPRHEHYSNYRNHCEDSTCNRQ